MSVWLLLLLTGTWHTDASQNTSESEFKRAQEKIQRLPNDCGIQGSFGKKVVGGTSCEAGEFPWMAALGYFMLGKDELEWRCGGALITAQHVVTAAHCISFDPDKRLGAVRLGDLDLNDTYPEPWQSPLTININISDVIVHSQYNKTQRVNDIAVINLRQKVAFTTYVRPICLPQPNFDQSLVQGENVTVAGWGVSDLKKFEYTYSFDAARSTRLQKVDVAVTDQEQCKATITSKAPMIVVDKRVLCAGLAGKDSCMGDSGGPLMKVDFIPKKGLRWFILGVVSYGPDQCGIPGVPGAYTRVSEFMGWILNHVDI